MPLPPQSWFVVPLLGVLASALFPLVARRAGPAPTIVVAMAASLLPIAALGRSDPAEPTVRVAFPWSTVGGPSSTAGFRLDALAVVGAAAIALVLASALAAAGGRGPRALPVLVLGQAVALTALVAVDDLVVGALCTGAAAATSTAVALGVARGPAAARLAALLALGVQAFIAAALLVGRFGIRSFALEELPTAAVSAEALAAVALGGALFCGLYPFVPWRYARGGAQPMLGPLRGALVFPTGIAGTVFALRLVGTASAAPATLRLPEVADEARVATALAVAAVTLGAAVVRRRWTGLVPGAVVVAVAVGYPALRWGEIVGLLALLTVAYASLASAAAREDWGVARFDARLATLWAAAVVGTPLALAGALFGTVASALSLAIEVTALEAPWAATARVTARVLAVTGPFVALTGIPGTSDPVTGALGASTLAWAGLLEGAHAVADGNAEGVRPSRERWFQALVGLAAALVVAVVCAATLARAAHDVFAGAFPEANLLAAALLFAVVAAAVVAVPERVRPRHLTVADPLVRRVLDATDPVPGALLLYRLVEGFSSRVAAAFALFEERAGVWVATIVIAVTLLWAAST